MHIALVLYTYICIARSQGGIKKMKNRQVNNPVDTYSTSLRVHIEL